MHLPHWRLKGLTILKTANCSIRSWRVTRNLSVLLWRQINSLLPSHMNGIFSGQVVHVKASCMKDSMSFRESTTSHKAMKSQERTDCALILLKCKRSLDAKNLILFQTPIFCQMNSMTSMPTIKNLNKPSQSAMYGLWSQQIHHVAEVSI